MNFDLLAPHYRWMEWLLAGKKLQRCRTAFMRALPAPRRVLLLGEGNGKFLAPLAGEYPNARFTCVDASARMLQCAQERLRRCNLQEASVEFIHADVLEWVPAETYDVIVTHFFLDCFRPEQLARIVSRLAAQATPGARWLLADFREPEAGWVKWRARLILKSMYLFFQAVTGLPASKLTAPDALLKQHGFTLGARCIYEWGLLHSDVWVAAES